MKKERLIAITGAGGAIGRSLIQRILEKTNWSIWAFSSSIGENPHWGNRVKLMRNDELITTLQTQQDVDTCVHLAFSRRFNTDTDIALSLNFSANLYNSLKNSSCRVINISTVGVYGLNPNMPDESTLPSPDSLYSMAKYASEVLMSVCFQDSSLIYTNIRLSGIAQSQRVLPVFIDNAKNNGEILITGGNQQFSWIDIADAVDGIISLIAFDGKWRPVYNLTLNKQRYSIIRLAEIVSSYAETNGYGRTKINIIPREDKPICVGWNSEAFSIDTGWQPVVSISDTIKKMF